VETTEDRAAVSIGTFDGVHLGHQAILAEVHRRADADGIAGVAYAFDAPPRLRGKPRPGRTLLLPAAVKARLILRTIDRIVRVSLPEVRNLPPQRFAETVLAGELHASSVVVGPSFRFGAGRAGDPETLRRLGEKLGFGVHVVPPVVIGGEPVSSSRIRSLLASGKVAQAAALLGRPPVLIGEVVRGGRVGRTLGYPTANLALDPSVLLPAAGVFAARAFVGDPSTVVPHHPALLYVGRRPTLGSAEAEPRCEVHLLTPPSDELYGRRIEVHLLEWLRGDVAFPSLAALRRQMDRDAERAAEIHTHFQGPLAPIGG